MRESADLPAPRMSPARLLTLCLILTCTLGLALAPHWLNLYWLRLMSYVFMYATLAQAVNLIAGYTGYPAFGNVVFFGIGAYATTITMVRYGGSFASGLVAAVLLCLLLALLLGPALLRLRGHYFAIVTVGLNEATRAVVENLRSFTGGGMGLSVPLRPVTPTENSLFFYYLLFAMAALSVIITWRFSVSRLGHACRAIRDNESKAEAMGIRTTRAKTLAWMMSAALTGAIGGIHAYWLSYIEPASVFDMAISVKSFVIFLLGGAGTVFGPLIAAVFVELIGMLTWSYLLDFHLGVMGCIIIVVVMFMPDGFAELLRQKGGVLARIFLRRP